MPLLEIICREKEIIMVFPYLPGRDLFRFLKAKKYKRLSEYEAQYIFKQLVHAMKTVHGRGIIHRDIKPENIMIDNELNIFLSDFGLAVRLGHNRMHRGRAGTPCYYPYEMVKGKEYD
mmetsp:Transcript_4591/g.3093  ORF Transcript_4591/g.3093 Transcript_4591/m.3093 type:complete len:118 (-) Transcript_4591:330-683(-)